jgi:hypothetical protein
MPGADAPAAKNTRVVRHCHTGNTRHPRAMVYGLLRAPRRSGFFATVACGTYRKLDTSVEMSGPHDLAVRNGIARLARRHVHRIPPRRP